MKKMLRANVDYRKFRFSKLKTPEFSHLLLLLFWPVYGFMFMAVEILIPRAYYQPVWCEFDNFIPFNELFIIPYWAWFGFLIGMILYLGVFDVENFKNYMYFIIITYSVAIITYLIWPNCQELRPEITRDNIFARAVRGLYDFDTNTNVCPSIHVLGMAASFFGGWYAKGMQSFGWKVFWLISLFLVSASTVFLKQHSIIDVIAAAVLCIITYFIVYKFIPYMKTKKDGNKKCTISVRSEIL
ncbi:MAG: phosphatase PAP2 family protein [Clostridia bacterium]|nr:phosphatase PAP2 family protein [Clostridia bacterium]